MSKLVDFTSLKEMLYGDEDYIQEFADAAIISFSEFNEHYKEFLLVRDENNFRRAGHKIKPVAQMLGLQLIIDEYEFAKTLLWEDKPDEDLQKSAQKMNDINTKVLAELRDTPNL